MTSQFSASASKDRLGAVLLQGGQPVAYVSRALTDTESRYAQIEEECLYIVFACEKFHQYIYGRRLVYVQNDHQPPESIFKKPLSPAPARLQRMLLRLQPYSLSMKYVRGSQVVLADTLSRAFVVDTQSAFTNSLESVYTRVSANISNSGQDNLRMEMAKDSTMQALYRTIASGWPTNKTRVYLWRFAHFTIFVTNYP